MRSASDCARVVLVAASLLTPRSTAARQPYSPDPSPPDRVELSGSVEVPVTLESNLPVVDVRINDTGPYRFGIETGANFVSITRELAGKLSLKRTGGPDESPAYRVESI